MNATMTRPTLTLEAPLTIRHGDRSAPVGLAVWAALHALTRADGDISAVDLATAVYGGPDGRGRLHALTHRTNEKLAAVVYPLAVSVEGDRVYLI